LTRRRRGLKVRHLEVAVHDDLVVGGATLASRAGRQSAVREEAQLAAVIEARSGQMRDSIGTGEPISIDQDRIIRSQLRGVLVDQGAAGSGKAGRANGPPTCLTHGGGLPRLVFCSSDPGTGFRATPL
jgi:DNA helicase IV